MLNMSNQSKILSPLISKFRDEIKNNKEEAVSNFWKEVERRGTPIIEEIDGDDKFNVITFLAREEEEVSNIICNSLFVTDDIKEGLLERIDDTSIYFRSYKILKGIRDTYCLSKNTPLEPKDPTENIFKYGHLAFSDPFNSESYVFKVDGFQLRLNEFESPDALPQTWYGKRTDINHGTIEEFTSFSEILNNERQVLVYTPPNYSKEHSPYHFLLLFDGILFEEIAKASYTLDNLIADEKIPPIVAVMIENFLPKSINLRSSELPPNPKFLHYIIEELLPWIRENFNITSDPSQSVIAGASYGGLASSFIAFKHPEIFTNVLSMSGAFAWYPGADYWLQRVKDLPDLDHWWLEEDEKEEEWLIRQFVQSQKLPLKFYLDVGVLEETDPTKLFVANRHFRNVLLTKGYPVSYVEFLGGHDFICWRGSIADGLIYLIGK